MDGEYSYDHKRNWKKCIKWILEYEGEYFFYKKWNGKWFNEKSNIICELKDGNGKVPEYNENDKLKFESKY